MKKAGFIEKWEVFLQYEKKRVFWSVFRDFPSSFLNFLSKKLFKTLTI
jgi:hypothetical protein